ncbi:hypothetical protein Cantr_04269 [Candida viswanathii]|uniref:EamA domain-containing protein n=1 Tax=Candida viswanathii TaxID=5486 RepID=A0A367XNM2_9ASCO|nr:hypothetical protein Cantr_04269 [Candida viswanathii]
MSTTDNTVLNDQPLVADPIVITDATIIEAKANQPQSHDNDLENHDPAGQPDKASSTDSFTLEDHDWETTPSFQSSSSSFQRFKHSVLSFYERYISPNIGLSLLLLSQFLNSIMVTTCKLLVTNKDFNEPIHPAQILFVRMFITYICCLLYMGITRSVPEAPLGPKPIRKLLLLRGFVGFFGVFGMYFSLQYLSLSDAVALTFLVPMVTAFLAYLMLHEKYSILEAVCSIFSLGGVVLIAKPSFLFGGESDKESHGDESVESSSSEKRILATVIGLVGVCGASCVYIVLRKIGMNAHPLLSVSYFALTCCIVTFLAILVIPSMSFVLPSNAYQWTLFFIIGLSGFFMQFSLTAGVQRVKASRASLMAYSGMIFAVVWDVSIWHHFPGVLSLLGITLIIGNAIIILKFKPQKEDSEKQPVGGDDLERNGKYLQVNNNNNDSIAMQEFIITDDEEEEESEHSSSK